MDGLAALGPAVVKAVQPVPWSVANSMLDAIAPPDHRLYTKGAYLSEFTDDVIDIVTRHGAAHLPSKGPVARLLGPVGRKTAGSWPNTPDTAHPTASSGSSTAPAGTPMTSATTPASSRRAPPRPACSASTPAPPAAPKCCLHTAPPEVMSDGLGLICGDAAIRTRQAASVCGPRGRTGARRGVAGGELAPP